MRGSLSGERLFIPMLVLSLVFPVETSSLAQPTELLSRAVSVWYWRSLTPPVGGQELVVLDVGDLTGDGLDDVVVSDHQAIMVFAGQPDGSFDYRVVGFYEVQWHDGWYTAKGSVYPLSGALADLDDDGLLDLVVGVPEALYLFRNGGWGGLEKEGVITIPISPERLWILDYTGDGRLDLLFWGVNTEGRGALYLCEGRGAFAFASPLLLFAGGGWPFAVVDVDKDGFPDLALYHKAGLFLFLSGPRRLLSWESPYGAVNHARLSRQFGDRSRVLVATTQGLLYGVLHSEGFKEEGFLPVGQITWVEPLDLTGDALEDAMVSVQDGWAVVPGKEDGSFYAPTSEFFFWGKLRLRVGIGQHFWPMTLGGRAALVVETKPFPAVYGIGPHPRGQSFLPMKGLYLVAVGDLSGNNAPDLIVEGPSGLEVFWNDGKGAFVRTSLLNEEVQVITAAVHEQKLYLLVFVEKTRNRVATELWTVSKGGDVLSRDWLEEFGPRESNAVQPALLVVDLDGNGTGDVLLLRKDAVLVKWDGKAWASFPWTKGNLGLAAAGQFTRKDIGEVALLSEEGVFFVSFPNQVMEMKQAPFALMGLPLGMAAGDLDGDGHDDLVVLSLEVGAQLGEEGVAIKVVGHRGWVLWASGKVTVLPLPQLLPNDAPWPLRGLAVGDFTGDGIGDIAFTTVQGAGVYVLPGRGEGMFAEAVRIPRALGPLLAADLDRSGQLELIGSSLGLAPYLWIRWNGGAR